MTRHNLTLYISALLLVFSNIIVPIIACDYNYNIVAEKMGFIYSPGYPNNYTTNSSCRYIITAPLDYDIKLNCSIDLQMGPSGCSTEIFYVANDGDKLLRGSDQFCGQRTVRRKSSFNRIVLAYISNGSYGRFRCQLYAAPQPCDCGWSANTKIVNGKEAGIHEYPHMVVLADTSGEIFCGGTILSHSYILTAAHCTHKKSTRSFFVAVGEHDIRTGSETHYTKAFKIQQIIEHPDYRAEHRKNDISLLVTEENIEWSKAVGPICLPQNASDTFAYNYADIMGWGTTEYAGEDSPVLLKTTLQIVENAYCAEIYPDYVSINDSFICTFDYTGQGRDSCQYDSGGPVVLRSSRQFLIGCISFGIGCGYERYAMGVNTRITSYLDWIKSYVKNSCNMPI